MKKLKVKVCGLTNAQNIKEIASSSPDLMGFIFYKGSKRFCVNSIQPTDIKDRLLNKVGVFVNESPENIFNISESYGLDIVQLHGNESPEFCLEISKWKKVIKVFKVSNGIDANEISKYENTCDYFLFDTYTEQHGGSGKKFTWELLNSINIEKPFFLSGGINNGDTEKLKQIKNVNFYGVDINSQFESEIGIKNPGLIKEFINQMKS